MARKLSYLFFFLLQNASYFSYFDSLLWHHNCPILPTTRPFIQQLVQPNNKEDIKATKLLALFGDPSVTSGFSSQRGSDAGHDDREHYMHNWSSVRSSGLSDMLHGGGFPVISLNSGRLE